ncbi:hypothetical protein BOTBODRAFT_173329 [Botryobasidium botryosum FD-172 SS1]|uniref:Zn(2)-C6 fungal-type domain-containing protein n=1 Tax=Botryobasidium botryosum (strain FD-172 SS1) TaxID=930990 RepID=A0A067MJU3_BOTB1|nr:hypothetical protein BOTBODRAFT_173329 [Botryobasidium botryosum FD-172 SS1]
MASVSSLALIPAFYPSVLGDEVEKYDSAKGRWSLQRGAACIACRKKKHKCDGQRPVCGRCLRAGTAPDCVYSVPKARAQTLQNKLRDLETQIQVLSTTAAATPNRTTNLSALEPLPFRAPKPWLMKNPAPLGYWWEHDELPVPLRDYLLSIFIQNRRSITFEFNVPRLQQQVALPPTDLDSLHPAFTNAIYMAACHFGPEDLSKYEPVFLRRVQRSLYACLESADKLFDFIRAYALMAMYYYFKGRLTEGHFHGSAAMRFAMACGLHRITPHNPSPSGLLNPPKDDIELGDRIHTFWYLFISDRGGCLWCGLPQSIADEEIETAWPRLMEDYEEGNVWGGEYSSLCEFLGDSEDAASGSSDTVFCQRMKGIVLMERATRLVNQAKQEAPMSDKLAKKFQALRRTTIQFLDSLSSSPAQFEPLDLWHAYLLACSSAHGASILINTTYIDDSGACHKRCISSAGAVVSIVHLLSEADLLRFPGLGWINAFDVLVAERKRIKRLSLPGLKGVEAQLGILRGAMAQLAKFYPTVWNLI